MPEINIDGIKFDNPVEQFINACKTISGAEVKIDTPLSADERGETSTVKGDIAVAENGCIWIPQREDDRSFLFKSEHLNIIVSRKDVVNNMHEAYDRIAASQEYFKEYKFGTFISGPSKTADIEGALVYGAQAARSVTVYLVD
ncbi:MAG: LUD domain-containing protein [Prevotellaceae bacterium]|nr:LUD domain-containing protein [Prevotellaceae bacterium]